MSYCHYLLSDDSIKELRRVLSACQRSLDKLVNTSRPVPVKPVEYALDYALTPWNYHKYKSIDFECETIRFSYMKGDKKLYAFSVEVHGFIQCSKFPLLYTVLHREEDFYKHSYGFFEDWNDCLSAFKDIVLAHLLDNGVF